jgi:hypothetical protein
MFCPSHALAGIGVGDRQEQPDHTGREQNRIEHEVFSCATRSVLIQVNAAWSNVHGKELSCDTYKFESEAKRPLYKRRI